MIRPLTGALAILVCVSAPQADAGEAAHRNLVIFVADGLRSEIVTPASAPNLAALRADGVDFRNSHSLYPTITTPNASTIATGHMIGDTGNFGNSPYLGFPTPSSTGSSTPFLENDAVLGDVASHFGGNYLNEVSVLTAASASGLQTAAIGKAGPVAIQALTSRDGRSSIVIDDETGHATGLPITASLAEAMRAAGLQPVAPGRGANGQAGTAATPGTLSANVDQQAWFSAVASKVLLPGFKADGRPFVLVYWSRDPDGTQHNQGDSLGALTPGINGPTSMAAIRNVDSNLGALRSALAELNLADNTDILVTADHGFSTVDKQSKTSPAGRFNYPDVPKGQLPLGFLAIDIAAALGLPLFDADGSLAPVDPSRGEHSRFGSALLGPDPKAPQVVVTSNGGTDLIYLPNSGGRRKLARKIVSALQHQDYTSVVFVDDDLGLVRGALPLSVVGLRGAAITPRPAIVIGFRSHATGCGQPELCAAEIADTSLQQGQGVHGAFSRADTHNFMAAIGPDFKAGFVDPMPTSNADIGRTAAHLLGLDIRPKGQLSGRVLSEAIRGGETQSVSRHEIRAKRARNGFAPVLLTQTTAGLTYFEAAGIPGSAVGLPAR